MTDFGPLWDTAFSMQHIQNVIPKPKTRQVGVLKSFPDLMISFWGQESYQEMIQKVMFGLFDCGLIQGYDDLLVVLNVWS